MNTTQQNSTALATIIEMAESYGSLYAQYSGRGMYGQQCVGIVTDNPSGLQCQALKSSIEGLAGYRTDSMGLDTIVYWPHIRMPEPAARTPAELAADYLSSYLSGYGRDDPARLRSIASRNKWASHASAVLDQRQYKLLDALDDFVLLEIEAGTVDMREIALAVANALDAEKGKGRSHG